MTAMAETIDLVQAIMATRPPQGSPSREDEAEPSVVELATLWR
jgi:hypothetical protein